MNNTPPEVLEKWKTFFVYQLQSTELYKRVGGRVCDHSISPVGKVTFEHWEAETLWQGFLMGRQTAVVELPRGDLNGKYEFFTGRNIGICECRIAIEKQGYQVKIN